MKKFISGLFLIASLSMISVMSAFALPEAKNLDSSYSWKKVDDEWTVVNKNGVMKTGWAKVNSSWYYLNEENGKLVTDKWIDNYYVNSDGEKTKTR